MLYLIGLGLNEGSYSREAEKAILNADEIYIENYTVDFPYDIKNLEKRFKRKKFLLADRKFVESLEIIEKSTKKNVVLLIYGSPLVATTHIVLISEAKKRNVEIKIISNASVLDAIGETGLQIYKFGKIASMPKWKDNFNPNSFIDIIKDNQRINAHSLILIDIGLEFLDAIKQLEEVFNNFKIKFDKIVLCQSLGTKNQKIIYGKISELRKMKGIKKPFCLIIPAKMHFVEEEFLNQFLI